MEFNFSETHQKEVGDDTATMGFPDDGNGRYMQKRSYLDWYYFNVAKRVHRNDVEHIITVVPLSLINGLVYPYPTMGILALYFLGRQLYTTGYFEKDGAKSNKRMIGSMMVNTCNVSTMLLTIGLGMQLTTGKLLLSKVLYAPK